MAELLIEDGALHVRLSALEKLGALRGDITLPLRSVTAVGVSDDPLGLSCEASARLGQGWRG